MIEQLFQLVGALLVLGAFVGVQLSWFEMRGMRYLALNTVGSGILAIIAIWGHQWGFLLLEGTWAFVSIVGLVQAIRYRSDVSA